MRRLTRSLPGLSVLFIAALITAGCSSGGKHAAKPAAPSTAAQQAAAKAATVDWSAVEGVFNRKADVTGEVHRFGFSRSDLIVKLGAVTLKPGFALGSYAAFMPAGDRVMVMGDLVLTEAEVLPVMTQLQQHGLEMTALHNHLIGEQPRVMYMHYEGFDADAVALARNLRTALQASATPLGAPAPPAPASDLGFDTAQLDRTFGRPGTVAGGLYKQSIARGEEIKLHLSGSEGTGQGSPHDVPLTPAMGVGTVINFQPLGGGQAAITGDFALLGAEVDKVAKTLVAKGIEVTAAHTHATADEPTLYYMHFFATGEATKLAEGLRAAIDQSHSAPA
jgi:hypothetical protein